VQASMRKVAYDLLMPFSQKFHQTMIFLYVGQTQEESFLLSTKNLA